MRLDILNVDRKVWLPSLNALRAFEAVARHMSFRKAANELNVTPAAVQQLVRGLEAALNRRLVVREGRTMKLTEAAKEGVSELHEAFDQLTGAVGKMRAHTSRQKLRISVEPSFASAWLVGRLQRFQEEYPGVEVLIDASFRVVDLNREEADIAIRYTASPKEDLVSKRLFKDETIAVCSPRLLKSTSLSLTLRNLAKFTLIHFEWPHQPRYQPDWDTWLNMVGGAGLTARGNLRFTDYNLALQSAIAGQGIALVSRPLVQDSLAANLLVTPLRESVTNGFGYDLVALKQAMERIEVKAFVNWIQSEIERSEDRGPLVESAARDSRARTQT